MRTKVDWKKSTLSKGRRPAPAKTLKIHCEDKFQGFQAVNTVLWGSTLIQLQEHILRGRQVLYQGHWHVDGCQRGQILLPRNQRNYKGYIKPFIKDPCLCFLVCKMGMIVCMQSCLTLVTLWTVAHQVLLSLEFSRQVYWSGLPFPSPGNLPSSGIKCWSPVSHTLEGGFFTTEPSGKPLNGHVSLLVFA